jgi:hypothetical protein
MHKSCKLIAAALIIGCCAMSGFSQNLVISGPGDVLFPGQKKTPFEARLSLSTGPNASECRGSFDGVPTGKVFVCTNLTFCSNNTTIPVSLIFYDVWMNSMNDQMTFYPTTQELDYSGYIIHRSTLMYFKDRGAIDFDIRLFRRGNLSGYWEGFNVFMKGYLVDAE